MTKIDFRPSFRQVIISRMRLLSNNGVKYQGKLKGNLVDLDSDENELKYKQHNYNGYEHHLTKKLVFRRLNLTEESN